MGEVKEGEAFSGSVEKKGLCRAHRDAGRKSHVIISTDRHHLFWITGLWATYCIPVGHMCPVKAMSQ